MEWFVRKRTFQPPSELLMEHDDKTLSQPSLEEVSRQPRGPVELDPADFAKVSGGLPSVGWSSTATASAAASLAS